MSALKCSSVPFSLCTADHHMPPTERCRLALRITEPDMAPARCTQVNQRRISGHFGKLMSFVWLLQRKRAPRFMSSRR